MYNSGAMADKDFLNDKKVFFKYIGNPSNEDFSVTVAGYEKLSPGDPQKGFYCKPNFSLHYCLKGQGDFTATDKNFRIKKDDIFVIFPNTPVRYIQDDADPWEYVWFEFYGQSAVNYMKRALLTAENPVYHVKSENSKDLLLNAISALKDVNEDLILAGNIILFLAEIVAERAVKPEQKLSKPKILLDNVIKYVNCNYSSPSLTLTKTSNYFYTNKNYLTRIFKKEMNTTFNNYVLMLRINKACDLLKNTDLPIKTVAYSVGFSDALYFSRQYKKVMDFAPSEFHAIHYAKNEKEQ